MSSAARRVGSNDLFAIFIMKAYILTTEYNHYDQMGEYFIAWFHKKPSPDELRQVMIDKEEEDFLAEATEEELEEQ